MINKISVVNLLIFIVNNSTVYSSKLDRRFYYTGATEISILMLNYFAIIRTVYGCNPDLQHE